MIVIAAVSVVYKITEHRPKRHTAEDGKVTVAPFPLERAEFGHKNQNSVYGHTAVEDESLHYAVGKRMDRIPHNACGVEKVYKI